MAHFLDVVRNQAGQAVPGANVSVFTPDTTTLVSLFSDLALTQPLANPTISSEQGIVDFYVAAGTYDILTRRFDIEDRLQENVQILDPTSTGPVGPAGGDLSGNYPNPNVDGLFGKPFTSPPSVQGQVPTYNGVADDISWLVPSAVPTVTQVFLSPSDFVVDGTAILDSTAGGSPNDTPCVSYPPSGALSAASASLTLPANFLSVDLTLTAYLRSSVNPGNNARFEWFLEDRGTVETFLGVTQAISTTDVSVVLSTTTQVVGGGTGNIVVMALRRRDDHVDDTSGADLQLLGVRIAVT